MPLQLLNHRWNNSVSIFQRVGKELLQISLQLINHRHNNFVGILQRVEKKLLQMPLQLKDGISDRLKWVIFFWRPWFVYKTIGKFINDGFTDKLEITDEYFSNGQFPFVISSVK